MLNNHVTVINDNVGSVPPDKMPQIERLSRLAGARFVLNEITHEESVRSGSALTLNMNWSNKGAGKVYKPYLLRFYFLDYNNRIAFTIDTDAEPVSWLPGDFNLKESIQIPVSVSKGSYRLAIALVSEKINQPSFRLAINVPETNGLYIISNIKIY
jgi:hypothetical protein